MNQKDAVFEAVKLLKPREIANKEPVTLSKQEKAVIQQKLFDGFKARRIDYSQEIPGDEKLAMYVSGLLSNWLRKDPRLNGDRRYVPMRPGSRSGLGGRVSQGQTMTLQIPENVDPETRAALEMLAKALPGAAVVVVRPHGDVSSGDEDGNHSGTTSNKTH